MIFDFSLNAQFNSYLKMLKMETVKKENLLGCYAMSLLASLSLIMPPSAMRNDPAGLYMESLTQKLCSVLPTLGKGTLNRKRRRLSLD